MSAVPPLAFLDAVAGYTRAQSSSSADRPIKLAKIDPAYDGLPEPYPLPVPAARVTFEGESTLSTKAYPVANGFVPVANQRVYLAPIGTSYLIIGAVNAQTPQGFWQNGTGTQYGVELGGGSYWDSSSGLMLETDAEIQGDLYVVGIGAERFAYKPSITSRTNSTSAADPHLTLTLGPGDWLVTFDLILGGTTGDIKTSWAVTGQSFYSLKTCWGPSPFQLDTSTAFETRGRDSSPMRTGVHPYSTDVTYGMNSTSFYTSAWERGMMRFASGGTVTLSWAQETTDATASSVVGGSYMTAKRVA